MFKSSTISNNVVAQVAQILTYVTGLRADSYAEFIAVHLNSVKVFRRTFEAVEVTKFDFRMAAVIDIPRRAYSGEIFPMDPWAEYIVVRIAVVVAEESRFPDEGSRRLNAGNRGDQDPDLVAFICRREGQ